MPAKVVSRSGTRLEEQAALMLRACGLPKFEREYQYGVPGRKFRGDFCWPKQRVALEVQGGVFKSGRHGRGAGITGDYERLAEIQLAGWIVILASPPMIRSTAAAAFVKRALEMRS